MANFNRYIPDAAEVSTWLSALERTPLPLLMHQACASRREGHGDVISFSPKVFVPVTRLCRDACGYCTFAKSPREVDGAFLSPDEILNIAHEGAQAGCSEALFTLGDHPEQRYRVAMTALKERGHKSTVDYLADVAGLVQKKTGLLVHINAGILSADEIALMRRVSVSQGLMLESASTRLCQKGGPHYGCSSKQPHVRVEMIAAAGEQAVPFTTGILFGIGETRFERVEALLTIKKLHDAFGHIQEVIIQNFLPKPGTPMARTQEPAFEDLLWTVAAARRVLGPAMHIQAPPNLSFERFPEILAAGIDDWGASRRSRPISSIRRHPGLRWHGCVRRQSGSAAIWWRGCRSIQNISATQRGGSTLQFYRPRSEQQTPTAGRAPTLGRRGWPKFPCRASRRLSHNATERLHPSSTVLAVAKGSTLRLSSGFFVRAAVRWVRSLALPTRCGKRPAAPRCGTWSTAISIIPTFANINAPSAHFPRAKLPTPSAASHIISRSRKSAAALPKRGHAEPPKSACRRNPSGLQCNDVPFRYCAR